MISADESTNKDLEGSYLPRRLCSEIQLFDLCELECCHFKDGRFCTDPEMLARFESVAEPQELPASRFDDEDDDYDEQSVEEFEENEEVEGYSIFDNEDQQEQDDIW